jgi:hypothetical protein
MTERSFRTLLYLHLATLLAATGVGVAFPEMLPSYLFEAYERSSTEAPIERAVWPWAVVLPVLGAAIAGYVGLFLWRPWGRTLSLATTVLGFVMYPLVGPTVASWLESSLLDISNIAWGALLALAYFSPVSARFAANNSSKPTPLRGAA